MREQTRRRMERWAFVSSLLLANFSLILSYLFQAELLYSAGKAVIIFAVMYFICRIVISTWDKVSRQSDFSSSPIKTTMDALDDLEEKGIKVTYNPLREPGDDDSSDKPIAANQSDLTDHLRSGDGSAAEVIPGQINADMLTQRNEKKD